MPLMQTISSADEGGKDLLCAVCGLFAVCVSTCQTHDVPEKVSHVLLPVLMARDDGNHETSRFDMDVAIEVTAVLLSSISYDRDIISRTLSCTLCCAKDLSDSIISKIIVRIWFTILKSCDKDTESEVLQQIWMIYCHGIREIRQNQYPLGFCCVSLLFLTTSTHRKPLRHGRTLEDLKGFLRQFRLDWPTRMVWPANGRFTYSPGVLPWRKSRKKMCSPARNLTQVRQRSASTIVSKMCVNSVRNHKHLLDLCRWNPVQMDSRKKAVTQGILGRLCSSIRDFRRKPGNNILFQIHKPHWLCSELQTTILCIDNWYLYGWTKSLLCCYKDLIDLQNFILLFCHINISGCTKLHIFLSF